MIFALELYIYGVISGSHNFHMSEKLYTRYSAIALQIGCPYLETFNRV